MEDLNELLKYKKLLDQNIITQEEFEKKKIELLNDTTNSRKQVKVKKKISITKIILIAILIIFLLAIIMLNSSGKDSNTITLIDGHAGEYGVYNRDLDCYTYFLPNGTYKIISYKDSNKNRVLDLFNAIVWKSDDTSYSLKGKQYRKSASDETIYTTELPDTFTISGNEYIYIPMGWTIRLEIINE